MASTKYEWLLGFDDHLRPSARFDVEPDVRVERNGEGTPAANESSGAVLGAQRIAGGSGARIELDDRFDRTAVGGQATDEKGGRQEATREFGHHAFGQRELPAGGLPGGFECRGGRSVSTS